MHADSSENKYYKINIKKSTTQLTEHFQNPIRKS